mgnify:CR=1 FL=1
MNYPTDVVTQAGFGLQTAAISAGGYVPPNASVGHTDAASLFDGSTWSAIPSLNQALSQPIGIGTSTAGLATGKARKCTRLFDQSSYRLRRSRRDSRAR